MVIVLAALCTLTLNGCDNFYDALKFGERDAEAQEDLVGGNRVIIRVIDLGSFSIAVDDGALSPQVTVEGEATQFTMASEGTVRFESDSIEVQEGDIVIVRGSSQTGTVTIVRPSTSTPPPTTP